MSRRKHTNTPAWWAQPDEYLGPPTKVAARDGITYAAQTPHELQAMLDKHDQLRGKK